ncbi:hypothetical protein AB835_03745 [Candidatus Endobugula sertula]|uniref:Uncharacterized protein n=1 Tax=Candidatus Endobugula sertula TaxID=62101 RepID=A0A1D2QS89_9GAMM|nr:hypothetical protein AB835_03745 [Candidatus Endobugula sertula]
MPDDWLPHVHEIWTSGDRNNAIKTVVNELNFITEKKPKCLLLQLAFYLFLSKNFLSASTVFKNALAEYPDDKEILLNTVISLSRAEQHKEAITYATQLLRTDPQNDIGWDCITKSYHAVNDKERASRAGTNSLLIKDSKSGEENPKWKLPSSSIDDFIGKKKKVISFSLWGNHQRYIFGALRNLLLAPDLYPDWEIWIYLDNSVPEPFIDIFKHLGATILLQTNPKTEREKLCWRFKVANHPDIGYFMVRDIDSVFSLREVNAVQQWLDSDKWFHIIRDYWTHTDLILAGLWGGVAGVLPNLQQLLTKYQPDIVDTPNIDQWFLRDCIWRYVKTSCMIHDRCFRQKGSIPLPGPEPKGNIHVGSNEFAQRPDFQKNILSPWIGGGNIPQSSYISSTH